MNYKYYDLNGKEYDRVTNILRFSRDQKGYRKFRNWLKKSYDCDKSVHSKKINNSLLRGVKIHKEIENFLKEKTLPLDISNDFKLILPYLNLWKDNIIAIEKQVFSDKYKYAGTLDAMLIDNGKFTIIDWTTSPRRKNLDSLKHKFLQITAYSICYEEQTGIKIDNLKVVVIGGKIRIFDQKRSRYEQQWLNRLKLYNEIKKKIQGELSCI